MLDHMSRRPVFERLDSPGSGGTTFTGLLDWLIGWSVPIGNCKLVNHDILEKVKDNYRLGWL